MTNLPLYTPLLNGVRVKLKNIKVIEDNGFHMRRIGYKGTIETEDGKRYRAYGRSCGLPNCQCDAEIKPIEMKARILSKFEVKSGKNKGCYIVLANREDAIKILQPMGWGILVEEYNYNFYKQHGALGKVIITHSSYAPSLARKQWIKIK